MPEAMHPLVVANSADTGLEKALLTSSATTQKAAKKRKTNEIK